MKHVSILIPNGHTSLVNIEGTHQILGWVNEFARRQGREPIFDIQLIGTKTATTQTTGLFTVNCDKTINQIKKTDLIIIPAIHGDLDKNLELNIKLIPWIKQHYSKGAEVASYCIGAFFLASTGLLNGKKCATHWLSHGDFRKAFPEVNLVEDKIMTHDDRLYTSGGAYSYLNLLLYIIERYAGRDMAILISKTFMIDIDKHSQTPFIIFNGQKQHNDDEIKKIQEFIEINFKEKITIDKISNKFNISRRTVERRFKKATSNSINEYMQRVKIEAAKQQLELGIKTINEVMYDVGYNDNKAFRDVFKKFTGMKPIDYRKRYSSNIAS